MVCYGLTVRGGDVKSELLARSEARVETVAHGRAWGVECRLRDGVLLRPAE